MDCYLRRLKQELVRAERAPGGLGAHPNGYLAPPGHGILDARAWRKSREERGNAHREAEGRACPEGKGPRGNLEQRLCGSEATQASDRDRANHTQSERCPRNPREKRGRTPRRTDTRMEWDPGARTERAGRQCPAAGEALGNEEGAGRAGRRGARAGTLPRAGGQPGTGARGELAPPEAPSSAGFGRAGAAAGAGWAGCLPGLVCQQGGGWQLERQGRALLGGGARLADREREQWRPSQMSGLGLGLARECEGAGGAGRSSSVGRGPQVGEGSLPAKALLGFHGLHVSPLPPATFLFLPAPDFRPSTRLSCVLASASLCPF